MSIQQHPPTENADGSGAELSVTEARAGVRRGVSKILVISTTVAIVALAGAWLVSPHHPSHPSETVQTPVSQNQ